MKKEAKKPITPPYAAYKSFINFINGLRENGCPSHITRSLLPGSNSGKAMMAATLRFLKLVNEDETPSEKLKQLTDSNSDYSKVLNEILYAAYDFMEDPSLDLANTTTEKVSDRFKAMGASGSTISKCMAFFLAAARDADIQVSQYVKAPLPVRQNTGQKKQKKKAGIEREKEKPTPSSDETHKNMEKIVVSLPGLPDGLIYLPKNMNEDQAALAVKMSGLILENYFNIKKGSS